MRTTEYFFLLGESTIIPRDYERLGILRFDSSTKSEKNTNRTRFIDGLFESSETNEVKLVQRQIILHTHSTRMMSPRTEKNAFVRSDHVASSILPFPRFLLPLSQVDDTTVGLTIFDPSSFHQFFSAIIFINSSQQQHQASCRETRRPTSAYSSNLKCNISTKEMQIGLQSRIQECPYQYEFGE